MKKESKTIYNVTGLAHKRQSRRPLDKLDIFLPIPVSTPPPPQKKSINNEMLLVTIWYMVSNERTFHSYSPERKSSALFAASMSVGRIFLV
jgi:hypothetical protein